MSAIGTSEDWMMFAFLFSIFPFRSMVAPNYPERPQGAHRREALKETAVLTTFQDVELVAASILAALGFLWFLKRFWPSTQRRDHNDIIGWQVSVLGTTYAVIIGFMLYAVWTTLQSAEIDADGEANCLVNIFRLADGLPAEQRIQVHKLAREYADAVIEQEWPAMLAGRLHASGRGVIQQLWTTVLGVKPNTFSEQTSMNLTLTEISSMTEHRRLRELQSQTQLPAILWMVLILGGILTTLSSCLFGTDNFKLHCVQVFSLTLLLSLALVAIADIDRPYQGAIHVNPNGFERARATFAEFPEEAP
jgi:Protein of unknown function (DUF4239)